MAQRSFVRAFRDGVLFASAFAMVLYVTLASHRPAGQDERFMVVEQPTLEDGPFGSDVGEDRLASVVLAEPLR